jgi:hypothetical protein
MGKTIFTGFSMLWMVWVTQRYFHHHPEYVDALVSANFFLPALPVAAAAYLAWIIARRKSARIRLSPVEGILFFLLFTLVIGTVCCLHSGVIHEAGLFQALGSLAMHLLSVSASLVFFSLICFGAGRKVLSAVGFSFPLILSEVMVSMGLGICVLGAALGLLGFAGLFHRSVLWGFFLVLTLLLWKEERRFIKAFLFQRFEIHSPALSFEPVLIVLIAWGASLNFIDLIRPMPTGWDDLSRYMNHPKVLADTGVLPGGNVGWPWAVWIATGLKLQGSTVLALFISYAGVLLSCLGLLAFSLRFFSSARLGLLVVALFSLMPLTMHQSFADMKLDMGLFFFMILAAYSLFEWQESGEKRWLILTGVFTGQALAIKITAFFGFVAFLALLLYRRVGWLGFGAVVCAGLWACLRFFGYWVPDLPPESSRVPAWICLGISTLLFSLLLFRSQRNTTLVELSALLLGLGAALLPWLAKGFLETHSLSPIVMLEGRYESVPVNLADVDVDPTKCTFTSGREELTRYIGYEPGISRFLTLPWKMTMNSTVHGYYVDLSFLFLAFLPGLGLLAAFTGSWKRTWTGLVMLSAVSWTLWALLSRGVPWYNLFGFMPLLLLTGGAFLSASHGRWLYGMAGTLIAVSLLSMLLLRSTRFGNPATLRYAFGVASAESTIDALLPMHRMIAGIIADDPPEEGHPRYVYRIGTYIRYFIPDNLRRVFEDNQLDTFTCIDGGHIEEENLVHHEALDDERTLERLKALGFEYFIFDPNTAVIEQDPEGSLHKKAQRFVDFANQNLKVIYNDPDHRIVFMKIE